jgi:hypothetical protein
VNAITATADMFARSVLFGVTHQAIPNPVYSSQPFKTKQRGPLHPLIITAEPITYSNHNNTTSLRMQAEYGRRKDVIEIEYSLNGLKLKQFLPHGSFKKSGLGKRICRLVVFPVAATMHQYQPTTEYLMLVPSDYATKKKFYSDLGFEDIDPNNPYDDKTIALHIPTIGDTTS